MKIGGYEADSGVHYILEPERWKFGRGGLKGQHTKRYMRYLENIKLICSYSIGQLISFNGV